MKWCIRQALGMIQSSLGDWVGCSSPYPAMHRWATLGRPSGTAWLPVQPPALNSVIPPGLPDYRTLTGCTTQVSGVAVERSRSRMGVEGSPWTHDGHGSSRIRRARGRGFFVGRRPEEGPAEQPGSPLG